MVSDLGAIPESRSPEAHLSSPPARRLSLEPEVHPRKNAASPSRDRGSADTCRRPPGWMLDQLRTTLPEAGGAVVEGRENEAPLRATEVDHARSKSVRSLELVCKLRIPDCSCELGEKRIVHRCAVDDHATDGIPLSRDWQTAGGQEVTSFSPSRSCLRSASS